MSWESKLKLANNGVQDCAGISELGGGPHCKQAARRARGPLGENQPGRKEVWTSRLRLNKSTREFFGISEKGNHGTR